MNIFRQTTHWVKPIVFIVIALVIAIALLALNQISDQSREGVTLLTSIQSLAYKMSATEWALIGKGTVEAEDEETLSQIRAEIRKTLDQVLSLDPANEDLLAAKKTFGDYLKAMDEETALLKSGNLEEAKRIDEEKVDPLFDALSDSIASSQASFSKRAAQTRQIISIASTVLIMLAGVIIAALWSSAQLAWEKSIQVALEKERITQESQHNQELKDYVAKIDEQNAKLVSWTYAIHQIAGIQEISELMDTMVKITSERFGYSHVGVYIVNEQKNTAFLQAASSDIGKQLVGQGFHITPDRRNPLYLAVEQNRHSIASDTDSAGFIRNENFPFTRSYIVLPLAIRGKVIGALDLHSEQPKAFDVQDAEILQMLADLVAISIENIQLVHETKRLIGNMEAGMTTQTRETWLRLTSRHTPAYQYTPAGVRPIFSPKKAALEDGEGLNIPLLLHGQKIGTIRLKRKGVDSSWSERERGLVEKIADQVSLALENSRLVDEAQKNALRDQMIANTSSRIRETLDIESVVRTATTELRRVFDLKEAEISVGFSQIDRKHTSTLKMK